MLITEEGRPVEILSFEKRCEGARRMLTEATAGIQQIAKSDLNFLQKEKRHFKKTAKKDKHVQALLAEAHMESSERFLDSSQALLDLVWRGIVIIARYSYGHDATDSVLKSLRHE
jgi:hypothetical protein